MFNTQIIITTFSDPLIKSIATVVTMVDFFGGRCIITNIIAHNAYYANCDENDIFCNYPKQKQLFQILLTNLVFTNAAIITIGKR